MRVRQVVLVGVLAVAALLTGCAAGPPAGPGVTPRPVATPVTAMGCAETEVGPSAGAVPAEFEAVAVYLCDPHATETDAEGTWLGSRLTRYEGDLAALLAALAAPDAPPTDGACPAIAFVGPWLWLEGDAGTYVRAAYPSNACGMPRTDAVFAALDKLTVADEHFEPGRLVDSAAAARDGCPSMAAPLILLGHSAGAGPDLPEAGASVLCRYASEPPQSDAPDASVSSPTFVGARRLDAQQAAAVWRAAAAASSPAAATCGAPASRYVVLVPRTLAPTAAPGTAARGSEVTVELDGCRRVIDRAHRAFTAPDALLALLDAP